MFHDAEHTASILQMSQVFREAAIGILTARMSYQSCCSCSDRVARGVVEGLWYGQADLVPFTHNHQLMVQHDHARPHAARICTQFPEVLARLAYSPDTALCLFAMLWIGVYDQAFHFLPLPIPLIVGVRRHICVIALLTKWTILRKNKPFVYIEKECLTLSHENGSKNKCCVVNFCTKYIKSLLKSQSMQWKCWSGRSENTRKCQFWNIGGKEAKLIHQLHDKNTSLMPTSLSKCLIGHVNTMPGQLGWWERHVHWHS